MIFETERLTFRLFEPSDIEAMFSFWGDPDVMTYCGGAASPTAERFERTGKLYNQLYQDKGYTVFAVVLKESDVVIGAAGFNPTDEDTEIELIYHFAKAYWGNGYATEAAGACMEFAKKLNCIKLVTASIDPNHMASRHVLEKIGFEYKGMKWFEDTGQEEPYFEFLLG